MHSSKIFSKVTCSHQHAINISSVILGSWGPSLCFQNQELKQNQEVVTQEKRCSRCMGKKQAEAVMLTSPIKEWLLLRTASVFRQRRNLERQAIMSCCANTSAYLRVDCCLTLIHENPVSWVEVTPSTTHPSKDKQKPLEKVEIVVRFFPNQRDKWLCISAMVCLQPEHITLTGLWKMWAKGWAGCGPCRPCMEHLVLVCGQSDGH